MTNATAQEVPLTEQLRQVPALSRLVIDDGEYSTTYIPVGVLMHKAADLIDTQAAEIERLRVDAERYAYAKTLEGQALVIDVFQQDGADALDSEIDRLRDRQREGKMKRTPWFKASTLPVRAGIYEWRCNWSTDGMISRAVYHRIHGWNVPSMPTSERPSTDCRSCQWRGLTAPAKERK